MNNSQTHILEFLLQILIDYINCIFKLYIQLGGLSEDGVLDSFTDHPYGISFVMGNYFILSIAIVIVINK